MAAEPSYNFDHFRRAHVMEDVRRTTAAAAPGPGELAPDFELPLVGGGTFHLSGPRDRPMLVRFGSFT